MPSGALLLFASSKSSLLSFQYAHSDVRSCLADHFPVPSSLSQVAYCLGHEIVSRNALSLTASMSYGMDESSASKPETGSSIMFSFRTRTRMRPEIVWIEILAFVRCSVRVVFRFIRHNTMRKSCCLTSVLELRPIPRRHDSSLR